MGNYLTSPNSVKQSENGRSGRFAYGACAMQGWRVSMEDAHLHHFFERLECIDTSAALFGVYDGHGGAQVAQFVARHLTEELLKSPDFRKGRFDAAFRSAYVQLDHLLSQDSARQELELCSRPEACQGSDDPSPSPATPSDPPVAKATAATLNSSPAAQHQQQRRSLRASMKIGTKKLYGRGERKQKRSGRGSRNSQSVVSNSGPVSAEDEETQPAALSPSAPPAGEPNAADEDKGSPFLSVEDEGRWNKEGDSNDDFTTLTDAAAPPAASDPPPPTQSWPFGLQTLRSLFNSLWRPGRISHIPQGPAMLSGCTAVSVLVTENQVVVANAGDSRCVLCRGELAVELSKDHKPHLPEERARIYAAGGWLEMGRVNGNLNLSRALGDLMYKLNASLPPDRQIISPVPDVVCADLTDQDEFLIIGCDGIWESSTSQEIVDFIRDRIEDALQLSDVLEALFEELLSPNPTLFEYGCDNMTAICVDLRPESRRFGQTARKRSSSHSHPQSPTGPYDSRISLDSPRIGPDTGRLVHQRLLQGARGQQMAADGGYHSPSEGSGRKTNRSEQSLGQGPSASSTSDRFRSPLGPYLEAFQRANANDSAQALSAAQQNSNLTAPNAVEANGPESAGPPSPTDDARGRSAACQQLREAAASVEAAVTDGPDPLSEKEFIVLGTSAH